MFLSSEPRKILAYAEPVDLTKSIIGVVALVQSVLQEDSLSGCVYVFFNRRGNYLKLVTWDRTGYCLFANQLSSHCTSFNLMRGPWIAAISIGLPRETFAADPQFEGVHADVRRLSSLPRKSPAAQPHADRPGTSNRERPK